MNNKSILIISKDNTIIDSIKSTFNDYSVFSYFEDKYFPEKPDVIVLDDCDDCEKFSAFSNVVNISQNKYENVININRPFKLYEIFKSIEQILSLEEKLLKFKDFEIFEDTLTNKNKEIKFGNKEILIIKYLYKNNNVNKETLLEAVWGYNDEIETRVLENTINKIRQKFKSLGVYNFIIFEDGKYRINEELL